MNHYQEESDTRLKTKEFGNLSTACWLWVSDWWINRLVHESFSRDIHFPYKSFIFLPNHYSRDTKRFKDLFFLGYQSLEPRVITYISYFLVPQTHGIIDDSWMSFNFIISWVFHVSPKINQEFTFLMIILLSLRIYLQMSFILFPLETHPSISISLLSCVSFL